MDDAYSTVATFNTLRSMNGAETYPLPLFVILYCTVWPVSA